MLKTHIRRINQMQNIIDIVSALMWFLDCVIELFMSGFQT